MIAFLVGLALFADARPTAKQVEAAVAVSRARYSADHPQQTREEIVEECQKRVEELQHDLAHAKKTMQGTGLREATMVIGQQLSATKKLLTAAEKKSFVPPVVEVRLADFNLSKPEVGEVGLFQTGVRQDSGWVWTAKCHKVLDSESVVVIAKGQREGPRSGGPTTSTSPRFILKGLPTKKLSPGQALAIGPVNLIYVGKSEAPAPRDQVKIYEAFNPDEPFK